MKPKLLSRFVLELMEYFCKHPEFTEVAIGNLYNAHVELQKLFGVETDAFNFSFSVISKLVPNVEVVSLCGFKLEMMEKNGEQYIECIRKWIKTPENNKLSRIVFRSVLIKELMPHNEDLVALQNKHVVEFLKLGWTLKYKYENDYHHISAERERKSTRNLYEETPDVVEVEEKDKERFELDSCMLFVDGFCDFVDNLDEKRKMELALATVKMALRDVLENQPGLNIIIQSIGKEDNTIIYRIETKYETQLEKAERGIDSVALKMELVEVNSRIFPVTFKMKSKAFTRFSIQATCNGRFKVIKKLADTLQGYIYLAQDLHRNNMRVVLKQTRRDLVKKEMTIKSNSVPENFMEEKRLLKYLSAQPDADPGFVRLLHDW